VLVDCGGATGSQGRSNASPLSDLALGLMFQKSSFYSGDLLQSAFLHWGGGGEADQGTEDSRNDIGVDPRGIG